MEGKENCFLFLWTIGGSFVELDAQIDSKIYKQPDGTKCCSELKPKIKMHVESKHIVSAGFNCQICQFYCPNWKSSKNHLDNKHGKERKNNTF
jgi:hypothetical protein